ncbi:ATP-binding cassette domain-containing protein [Streptomyces sp. HU2014]|uniref:ATP-binding cassette domain-containing protein n=1 Tax=Streptomyces sp. HU2014 TaxID=2939414 RepID=UPI00200E2708|nr:ATP-binding cassette domain-containing protein [Streptomyces sp. HU2014]UQI49428.1 ATP-binding cassette domain-containing protein [Streptomyces sp. HU2014]
MAEVRDLRVEIGGRAVVDGVGLTARPGRVTALVGASGSGKTTTGLALLGEYPDGARVTGEVRVAEGPVGYVPQHPASVLNPARRVGALLADIARAGTADLPRRARRAARRARVLAALAAAQLPDGEEVLTRYPHQLSGGQQQRVVLAQALLLGARTVVADEPTTGLDALTRRRVAGELAAVARRGVAVLLLSHDLDLVRELADEVLVMRAGRVVESGPTEELWLSPRHPWTRELLGTPDEPTAGAQGEGESRPATAPARAGADDPASVHGGAAGPASVGGSTPARGRAVAAVPARGSVCAPAPAVGGVAGSASVGGSADGPAPFHGTAPALAPAPGSVPACGGVAGPASVGGPAGDPAPVRGSAPAAVPACGSVSAPAPAVGGTAAPASAGGSAGGPAPVRGSALAPASAPGSVPAGGSVDGPASVGGLAGDPASARGRAAAAVPACGSVCAPAPAVGGTAGPASVGGSAGDPAPTPGSVPGPVPARGTAPGTPPAPVLEARAVTARHRGTPALLRDASLSVRAGECLAVVGRSGSGKTTLARCLAGLHSRYEGHVLLDGAPLPRSLRQRDRARLAAVQYVFQDARAAFDEYRPVLDQVARTAVRLRGVGPGAAEEEAVAALGRVGLTEETARRRPGGLSGGELQRAALVRALLARPRVLICDEVTSGLDSVTRRGILRLLADLAREPDGPALVLITHDLDTAALADRIAVLDAGRIVEQGPATEVLTAPRHAFTRALTGSSGAHDRR